MTTTVSFSLEDLTYRANYLASRNPTTGVWEYFSMMVDWVADAKHQNISRYNGPLRDGVFFSKGKTSHYVSAKHLAKGFILEVCRKPLEYFLGNTPVPAPVPVPAIPVVVEVLEPRTTPADTVEEGIARIRARYPEVNP